MNNNSTKNNNHLHVFTSSNKRVGYTKGNTFYKTIKESIHKLRFPPGFASDTSILIEVENRGVKYIKLFAQDTNETYVAKISDFWEHGIGLNRGFGEQIVLPIKFFTIDPPEKSIEISGPPKDPQLPSAQLTLSI
jgi:hypothetical protein